MNRFIDLPTRKKFRRVFSLLVSIMLILIAIASWLLLSVVNRQERLYREDATVLVILEKIDGLFHLNRANVLEMGLTGRNFEQKIAEVEQIAGQALDLLRELEAAAAGNPELQEKLRGYHQLYDAFRETRNEVIYPALRQGRMDEALAAVTGIQDQRYRRIYNIAQDMTEIARQNAEQAVKRANANVYRAVAIFIFIGIVAVVLSLYMASLLTRLITSPLQRINGYASEIAAGNLGMEIGREDRRDEFGALSTAFASMVQNLRELIEEILGGINVLAATGSEIVAATTQMASGAAETATAVNETTATVEEVKQTAHLATDKSQHVADIAQKAVQASQAGQNAANEAVEGMRQIMGQMEAVTDSIGRLSEISQSIGEIITTVNDLAEQSNLLAVNAAIEAAKAGEHGKGFAVVAQEVRHLAGQSKQATAQVRSLLGEIQKATSASVMATEQGTKAVESGMRQSSRAGEAIGTLAETVEEAATAALQIAASSKQQLVGMDQIALAMQNIKTAASQHVAGTRQTEEASTKLNELGSRLQELASGFRV